MQPIRLFLLSRYNKKRKSDFFSHYRTKRVNVCKALKITLCAIYAFMQVIKILNIVFYYFSMFKKGLFHFRIVFTRNLTHE